MRVAEIMTRAVKTVRPSTPVQDIVQILIAERISAVPVVNDQDLLVGIVSEADLLHRPETGTELRRPWWLDLFSDPDARAEAFMKAHGRTAQEVMSRGIEFVAEDTPLDVAAKVMDQRRIRRLPVLRDGRVVGIVARADLIRALAAGPLQAVAAAADDDAIEARFEQAIRDAGLSSAGSVTPRVHDGVVELWGVVQTPSERRAFELAAEELAGVKRVDSHLAVRELLPATF